MHNAALLLGQALSTGTEFRQAFAAQDAATAALARALRDEDAGTVCNAAFALCHFVSDRRCFLSGELRQLVEEGLGAIAGQHADARIVHHTQGLRSKLKERVGEPTRRQHVAFRRDKSITALQGLTNIAKERAMAVVGNKEGSLSSDDGAMHALASLASIVSGEGKSVESGVLEGLASVARGESDTEEEASPTTGQQCSILTTSSPPRSPKGAKAGSPGARRGSMLAPWKKAMAPGVKLKKKAPLQVEIPSQPVVPGTVFVEAL